ncbi:multiple sugar transport system permease protein [Desemzia incerta]|uniref:Multiple sugar transport system permease protein n=1 Tax=Desemzia incerta TaxID=82801 RepID=A0A1I5US10_9LACT|nr:carbohydrate ABC transporter permease [Desemzia incerta]SFP98061.1 multiple sugar transport system permease protein [Desemzia incerta]
MKSKKKDITVTLISTGVALIFLLPIVWMIFTSFKELGESLSTSSLIPKSWTIENYTSIFGADADAPILTWLMNTAIVTTAGTALVVFVDVLAAYTLARLNLPGKKIFLSIVVGALTIPGIVTLFPAFFLFREVGYLDTYAPLILPYSAGTMGVFLIYNFLRDFPRDLEEAAIIDGANLWHILRHVIMPTIKPVVATLTVITFLAIYNDFLWPSLVTSSDDMKTATVGLANLIQGSNFVNPGKMMASTVVATVPALIIFIFANKYFVRSVTNTGIK